MAYLREILATLSMLRDPVLLRAQLVGTWRIFLAICLVQLMAGAMCLGFRPYTDAFLSFWFGGAVASLPGFLLGLAWLRSARPEALVANRAVISLYAVCSVLMTVVAWPMAYFQNLVRPGAA
jgi:hypothetical protein